jgi:hypothetical protein
MLPYSSKTNEWIFQRPLLSVWIAAKPYGDP